MNIVVRHAEPEDYRELQRIYSGRRAVAGTLQLPLQSEEKLRKRLSEMPEGTHHLVACVDGRWSESWVWACLPTRARGIRAISGWLYTTTGRARASGRR